MEEATERACDSESKDEKHRNLAWPKALKELGYQADTATLPPDLFRCSALNWSLAPASFSLEKLVLDLILPIGCQEDGSEPEPLDCSHCDEPISLRGFSSLKELYIPQSFFKYVKRPYDLWDNLPVCLEGLGMSCEHDQHECFISHTIKSPTWLLGVLELKEKQIRFPNFGRVRVQSEEWWKAWPETLEERSEERDRRLQSLEALKEACRRAKVSYDIWLDKSAHTQEVVSGVQ